MQQPVIQVEKIFDAVSISASGNSTSDAYDLYSRAPNGAFSLQVAITGDGTAKFEYLLSNNNIDFIEPSSASDIATGVTKTSGPGSDGKDIYTIQPELGKRIKIKCTETGGSSAVVVSAWLAIQ